MDSENRSALVVGLGTAAFVAVAWFTLPTAPAASRVSEMPVTLVQQVDEPERVASELRKAVARLGELVATAERSERPPAGTPEHLNCLQRSASLARSRAEVAQALAALPTERLGVEAARGAASAAAECLGCSPDGLRGCTLARARLAEAAEAP